ncbi:REP-associated tyrosine transposase [Marinigracilibium pacificum]|uniref:Transposase n=1 Tax=Marinigracilibium pacificum TaxID=2729599 RepID=A0A848J7X9_9BACT|nr:transposase [Marinigracilibium pacificum]NMM50489.1 transposase [Marinigracilibium pacificum]
MSRKYKFGDSSKLYFISFAVVYWIDVFIRNEYKEILINSWKYCQENKDLEIFGWCIMTSHVHMIIGSKEKPLERIVADMKRHTSGQLKKAIIDHPGESRREWMLWMFERAGLKNSNNKKWQFWQQHNKPIELLNEQMFYQKLDYIHRNPVEAGFVEKEEEYTYSSAGCWHGKEELIKLNYIR